MWHSNSRHKDAGLSSGPYQGSDCYGCFSHLVPVSPHLSNHRIDGDKPCAGSDCPSHHTVSTEQLPWLWCVYICFYILPVWPMARVLSFFQKSLTTHSTAVPHTVINGLPKVLFPKHPGRGGWISTQDCRVMACISTLTAHLLSSAHTADIIAARTH